MKLQDLVPKKKGTYVGLRVLEPSASQIYKHCEDAKIPFKKSSKERRLHTTVLYSKVPCPKLKVEPETVHEGRVISYALFNNSSGEPKVLVVRLNAPSVVARHIALMAEHSASYDFPTFEPHVTLAHDYEGGVEDIPIITFPIFLGEEYVQELEE